MFQNSLQQVMVLVIGRKVDCNIIYWFPQTKEKRLIYPAFWGRYSAACGRQDSSQRLAKECRIL